MFFCFPSSSNSIFLAYKLPNKRRICFQQGFVSRFSSLQQIHFQVCKGNKSIIHIFIATFMDLKELFHQPQNSAVSWVKHTRSFLVFPTGYGCWNPYKICQSPLSLSTDFVVKIPQREHHFLVEVSAALPGVH